MKKGFTLIELLVVIAIIALLSSIVLASLTSARNKGANSAVKSNLVNMRAQGELYFTNTPNYTAVCSDSSMNAMLLAARVAGGGVPADSPCNANSTAWVASARLKVAENGNAYWCVDSTGTSKGINSIPGGTVCP